MSKMKKQEKYLLAAEADKIQDLLFNSSKLKEIAGASQMLAAFCEESVIDYFLKKLIGGGKIIISRGGSFRLLFNSKEEVEKCKTFLPEFYRQIIGGTITVAEEISANDEKKAIELSTRNLSKAKHTGKLCEDITQTPYMAVCSSCGFHIAVDFSEENKYICTNCLNKISARKVIKKNFLRRFLNSLSENNLNFPEETDHIAEFDLTQKGYVAYLVADGNNMGAIFGSCENFKKLKELSIKLEETIWNSLAKPTKNIIEVLQCYNKTPLNFSPVFPLIVGGDDIFAILPVQWAISFAAYFCKNFEEELSNFVEDKFTANNLQRVTMSAGIVICKKTYPFLSAYKQGKELLYSAKKIAKKDKCSSIAFRLIKGGSYVTPPQQNLLFKFGYPAYKINEIKELFDYRLQLKELSASQKEYLESLFHEIENIGDFNEMKKTWKNKIEPFLKRLPNNIRDEVIEALTKLGDENADFILHDNKYYHKLTDLLSFWDFLYDINKEVNQYFVEEED